MKSIIMPSFEKDAASVFYDERESQKTALRNLTLSVKRKTYQKRTQLDFSR